MHRQHPALTAAYAAAVRSFIAVISTLNDQVKALEEQVGMHFGQHPDAEIYLSQPSDRGPEAARQRGLGPVRLSDRLVAETMRV